MSLILFRLYCRFGITSGASALQILFYLTLHCCCILLGFVVVVCVCVCFIVVVCFLFAAYGSVECSGKGVCFAEEKKKKKAVGHRFDSILVDLSLQTTSL